jgi:cytidyltransferase-like protein
MVKKVVLVTGGFDPLHSGHIAYFKAAKELGDQLVVGINSDAWLTRKKGSPFMPWLERQRIIKELKMVDYTIEFNDDDNSSKLAIKLARQTWPDAQIIFANGGDRTKTNIPEMDVKDYNIKFVFGVGGENKANSSSWILQEWKAPKTERAWGYYRVLHEVPGTKVKELTVLPGQGISLQRHKSRHEFWHVTSGKCIVEQYMPSGYRLPAIEMSKHSHIVIPQYDWHRLFNPFDEPCQVVEIQYGDKCIEDDIERK